MGNLGETSAAYEPPKQKTVDELEVVSLAQEILEKDGEDKTGKAYKYSVINVAGEEYRVPNSVKTKIKGILELKPDAKTIKVGKTGEGLNTEYTVILVE